MRVVETPAVRAFIKCANDGWLQGWHERNGGNMSYRMRKEELQACGGELSYGGEWFPLGVSAPCLANEAFLVTGTNRYFQNILARPEENIGICQLNQSGDAWRLIWGLTAAGKPTSEFPTHILNHAVRFQASGGAARVIYHAHPVDVIALSFLLPPTARDYTRALWKAMTECIVLFPRGLGVVEWMVCGGAEIAAATSKVMEDYEAVVWAQHGLFCAGEDFDGTFGLMHAIVKAAQIYLKVKSSGMPVLQTIPDEGLRAIGKAFHLPVNEDFLE
ncbi:MAG: rhamnulose-1-phosphate aldolase [Oscillospiraceae bacterium]|jgi:rhamnulose-1-phosphate aldolase|nr:rhamnulose-1-phosphate aldolase [Oscillospiraceae bacterium]